MTSNRNKSLSAFLKYANKRLDRCLSPGMSCQRPAIRAHSVQNSRVLDLLVCDGHVKALGKTIDKTNGAIIQFGDVGRNEATTFTGFCSEHDSHIFRPIDANALDAANSQHLFLVAYRALAKELHAQMEAAFRIQGGYNERVRLGLDTGNEPEPVGMLALEYMVKSYSTYEYKLHFDHALVSEKFSTILHDVIRINHKSPAIAVCSVFAVDGVANEGDWVRVALNVMPINMSESFVMFSYLQPDAALARASLNSILNSTGGQQMYLLSKQILNSCENFVVSPTHFDKWSAEKRRAITDYFAQTLLEGHLEVENELLYLF
jgi:hypothetical protein